MFEGPKRGFWVRKDQPLSERASKRLIEMAAGNARIRLHAQAVRGEPESPTPFLLLFASDEEFAMLCGLVLVGQAERMYL